MSSSRQGFEPGMENYCWRSLLFQRNDQHMIRLLLCMLCTFYADYLRLVTLELKMKELLGNANATG